MNVGDSVKKPGKTVRFLSSRATWASFFVILLTLIACGLPGGPITCTDPTPKTGTLQAQGVFTAANNSGVSGILRTYDVLGSTTMTVEALTAPTTGTYFLILEARDTGVFFTTQIRASKCIQAFPTGTGLSVTNRFSQATLRATASTLSMLYGTALLTSLY